MNVGRIGALSYLFWKIYMFFREFRKNFGRNPGFRGRPGYFWRFFWGNCKNFGGLADLRGKWELFLAVWRICVECRVSGRSWERAPVADWATRQTRSPRGGPAVEIDLGGGLGPCRPAPAGQKRCSIDRAAGRLVGQYSSCAAPPIRRIASSCVWRLCFDCQNARIRSIMESRGRLTGRAISYLSDRI